MQYQVPEAPKVPWELPHQLVEPPRGPEVKNQMERLNTALANLEDTASLLGQRLEFVLTPEPPTPCAAQAGQPASIRSDMATAIDRLEHRVQQVNRLLNSIMNRLEV